LEPPVNRLALIAAISVLPAAALAAPKHPCANDAKTKTEALLKLHLDGADLNMSVDDKVKLLPPVRALKGKGKFDVLELTGYVYKAQYRVRMIYAQIPDSCLLMGQEVLEIANPY
jgi:hypothetical protein